MNFIETKAVKQALANKKTRSAWSRGVKEYAYMILENSDRDYLHTDRRLETELLNGAMDWQEYSYGGCALIYDETIARKLCNPSELIRTDNGRKNPNSRETWLDVQTRALYQAFHLIRSEIVKLS